VNWKIPDESAGEPQAESPPPAVDPDALYRSAVTEILASLLAGGGQFLGRRVALAWPDGPPPDWSQAALDALARKWKQATRTGRNHWVQTAKHAADADGQDAITEALVLSSRFHRMRGDDGEPDRLVPS
jgi:hypothetical protein